MGGCSEGQEIPGYASEDHMIVTITNTKYFALVAKLLTSLMLPLPLFLSSLITGCLEPNLADIAVFGVLRPIRHLKSGRDMVEHTRIGEWYSRMEAAVGESSRINA